MTSNDKDLHKEALKARMKADATDKSKIRQQLQDLIDPLDESTRSDVNIVQIVSGRIAADSTMNVHEAVSNVQR